MNFSFQKTEASQVANLKEAYLNSLAAPIDGMWECFVSITDHYEIQNDHGTIGYCAVNAEKKIIQFHVSKGRFRRQSFAQMLEAIQPVGAIAGTHEPETLSLCLDRHRSLSVHALMYHLEETSELAKATFPDETEFRVLHSDELETAIDFGVETLGDIRGWLSGYFADLVDKEELFGLWKQSALLATGERRISVTQKPYADLGVVVSKTHRGQGIARAIMASLAQECCERGLIPICSTESSNLAAQKAIEHAGFVSYHRILDVTF